MPDNPNPSGVAGDFCARLFRFAEGNVFIVSHSNERGAARERYISTRNKADIEAFRVKHDRPGFALYLCTSTLRADAAPTKPGGSIRHKGSVQQIIGAIGDSDLKGVLLDRPGIIAALLGLEMPPSIIVWSGRGAQPYWLFSEPLDATPETIAGVEALNKRIADIIGGDPVHDVSRLLRLPGSHNTKDGGWLDVEIVHEHVGAGYELEDLEEWAARQAPVIPRRPKPAAVGGTAASAMQNVYERIAAQFAFKIPVDVEARLAAMSHQGAGDSSIHNTQLAVSASLLSKGEPVEEVVELILAATRDAAGADGRTWNWDREEKAIRGMCADWQRKHPEVTERADSIKVDFQPKAQTTQVDRGDSLGAAVEPPRAQARTIEHDADEFRREGSTGGTVHHIGEARAKREKAEPKPKKERGEDKAPVHVVLGEAVLAAIAERGEAVLFTKKGAYAYAGGVWNLEADGLRGWLDVQISLACEGLRLDATNRVRSEVRGYIQAKPSLWRDVVPWDQHGKIPCRNGLVDPRTQTLEPPSAEHFATWRVEADFDPAAAAPLWEEMIADTFSDRPGPVRDQCVGAIQEAFGSALIDIKPRELSKALCFVGGSNCGKSGLLEVGGGMFGDDPIVAPMDSLQGTHGLMPFVKRRPWVLHEAFDQSKWLTSSTVKAIITGEPVMLNIKNGPMLTQRVRAPIFWATNSAPQFREATKAISNRLLLINCLREFDPESYTGVAAKARAAGYDRPSTLVLAKERPGVLNWLIAGLRRALDRGFIRLPDESKAAAHAMHLDSNLSAGFIEDCVTFDPDMRVGVSDFCAAFSVWWELNRGENRGLPSNDSIGRAVVALNDRRIAIDRAELRDNKRRYYAGIMLNEVGREFWKRTLDSHRYEGKAASLVSDEGAINTQIPGAWSAKPIIQRMRLAHAAQTAPGAVPREAPPSGTRGTDQRSVTFPGASCIFDGGYEGRGTGEASRRQAPDAQDESEF